jgi:hypothetical protein
MNNEKQQTAVQEFWDKIALKLSFEQIDEFTPLFYQAKEMENERMMQCYSDGLVNGIAVRRGECSSESVADEKEYLIKTYEGNK